MQAPQRVWRSGAECWRESSCTSGGGGGFLKKPHAPSCSASGPFNRAGGRGQPFAASTSYFWTVLCHLPTSLALLGPKGTARSSSRCTPWLLGMHVLSVRPPLAFHHTMLPAGRSVHAGNQPCLTHCSELVANRTCPASATPGLYLMMLGFRLNLIS